MDQIRCSIQTKLNIGIGCAVLFFLLLLLGVSYGLFKDLAIKNSRELTELSLQGTDKQISSFFLELESITRSIAGFPSVYRVETERMREQFLSVVASRRAMLRAVYLGTAQGEMYEWGFGPGFKNNTPSFPEGYDPRKRPWYRKAVDAGGFSITEPYLYASVPAVGITSVIPVHDPDSRFIGVLGVDVMLMDLKMALQEIDIRDDARLLLLNQQRKALVNQFGDVNLDLSAIEIGEEGWFSDTINGEAYHIAYRQNRISGWTVVLGLPYQSIMAEPTRNLQLILFFDALLMLLLFAVLGTIVNRLILHPLLEMVQVIRALERGNRGARISVGTRDEFALLGKELNALVDRVHDYQRSLEEKVESRSSEIEKLQQENLRLRIIEEKERIYGYLHDSLGARLTNIFLSNSVAQNSGDREMVQDMHRRIESNCQQAIADLKEILSGSEDAERRFIDFQLLVGENLRQRLKLCDIDFSYSIREPEALNELDPPVRFGIESILQELVSNVLKHSGADRVFLELSLQEQRVCIDFRDNGKGMEVRGMRSNSGFGLRSMRKRILSRGGRCDIESEKGRGTRIYIELECV